MELFKDILKLLEKARLDWIEWAKDYNPESLKDGEDIVTDYDAAIWQMNGLIRENPDAYIYMGRIIFLSEKHNWVATDENGGIYAFIERPMLMDGFWVNAIDDKSTKVGHLNAMLTAASVASSLKYVKKDQLLHTFIKTVKYRGFELQVPEHHKWISTNRGGSIVTHVDKPWQLELTWASEDNFTVGMFQLPLSFDWKDSLQEI